MTKIENDINEIYSPNLLFLNENRFEDNQVHFWPLKLTLKTDNAQLLSARHYFYVHDIKISFKYVNFYKKPLLVLDTQVRNSTTQRTLMYIFKLGNSRNLKSIQFKSLPENTN